MRSETYSQVGPSTASSRLPSAPLHPPSCLLNTCFYVGGGKEEAEGGGRRRRRGTKNEKGRERGEEEGEGDEVRRRISKARMRIWDKIVDMGAGV